MWWNKIFSNLTYILCNYYCFVIFIFFWSNRDINRCYLHLDIYFHVKRILNKHVKKKVICIAYLFISIKYDSFLQHDGISKHFFFNQTEINPMRVYRNDPNIFTLLANNNFLHFWLCWKCAKLQYSNYFVTVYRPQFLNLTSRHERKWFLFINYILFCEINYF